MASVQCSRHPQEKLRFMCQACETPICRDCKLTHHEGHPTTDIDLVASDLRHKLRAEKQEVDKSATVARLLQEKVRCSLQALDRTVEETRTAMDKRVEAVVDWARTYRLGMDSKLKEMRLEAKGEMESLLEYLEENADYLHQMTVAMGKALEEETSYQHVAQLYADYEQCHKGRYPAVQELNACSASHTRVITSTGTRPDRCQTAIQQYLGLPLPARVLKTMPPTSQWTFTTRVWPGDDARRGVVVSDILPMKDGSVSVLYRDTDSSGSSFITRLAHYSPEGLKRAEETIVGSEVVMVEPASCQSALFSVKSETWHQPNAQISASTPDESSEKLPTVAVYLKHGQKGDSTVVCKMTYPAPGLASRPPVELLSLDIQDALRVAINASGLYIAVLRKCNQVKVYECHGGSSSSSSSSMALSTLDVTSELKQVKFKDVCFGRVQDREVLLVAEGSYNVILLVDYLNGCVLISFLPSPIPHPTCVRADVDGALWVGCEGGEVVAGLPVFREDDDQEAEDDEEDMVLVEDAEGYLVPSEDLYVNINALISRPKSPPAADMPPERPPRPGVPKLPPRTGSSSSRSAGVGPLGMPLRPPARPPACPPWTRSPPPALEKQIQNLLLYRTPEGKVKSPQQGKESSDSQPVGAGDEDGQRQPSSALPQTSGYQNWESGFLPRDGEPGREKRKPLSPQTLLPGKVPQMPPKPGPSKVPPKQESLKWPPKSGDPKAPPQRKRGRLPYL